MDPKAIHDIEQSVAAFRTLAAGTAAYYNELVELGVPGKDATDLTIAMIQQIRGSE